MKLRTRIIWMLAILGAVSAGWGVYAQDISSTTLDSYSTTTLYSYPPAAPSNLHLYGELPTVSGIVNLGWTDNAQNEDRYFIERKPSAANEWTSLVMLPADSASYTDSSGTSGMVYDYRVEACLSNTGCSVYVYLNNIEVRRDGTANTYPTSTAYYTGSGGTYAIPAAPSNLSRYIPNTQSNILNIIIKWTDNATNEDKFNIERKTSSESAWVRIFQATQPNTTSYIDSAVTSGMVYDYRVQACLSGFGCSDYAYLYGVKAEWTNATTSVTYPLLPAAPSGLSLGAYQTSSYITLKWTDNATNEDKFNIERRLSGDYSWAHLTQLTGANITYYQDAAAIPGYYYDYRVQACLSEVGCSAWSTLSGVKIPLIATTTPVYYPPTSTTAVIVPATTTATAPTPPPAPAPVIQPKTATSPAPIQAPPPVAAPSATSTPVINEGIMPVLQEINSALQALEPTSTPAARPEPVKPEDAALVFKDTNKDGISDYDSARIYNMDPVKPSPVSVYNGKTVNAAEKVMLGFDPTKKELVPVRPEEPASSSAPVISSYDTKEVAMTVNKEIVLKGRALPNSFVTVFIYSTPIQVVVKADTQGEWQYTLDKELENGEHTVYTAIVGSSGNIIARSSPVPFIKTAEAVTLKDNFPIQATATKKPGLLEGRLFEVFVGGTFVFAIVMLILLGISYKKDRDNQISA